MALYFSVTANELLPQTVKDMENYLYRTIKKWGFVEPVRKNKTNCRKQQTVVA
jgi:hypothetical protein